MGLDMYLTAEVYHQRAVCVDIDDKPYGLKIEQFHAGYWRKHPNLHGFIVKAFANDMDNCQCIYLTEENLEEIIRSIKEKELPHTEGFFFGQSDGSEDEESIFIFEKVLAWLREEPAPDTSRYVFYRASW